MANEKRLIDAQPIVKFIMDGLNNPDTMKALGHDAIEILTEIEYAHTVDAVEVVHGRWLKLSPWNNHTQSCLCLNCDSISYQKKSGVYIGKIPNYCPNCGAKMDGDGDEK